MLPQFRPSGLHDARARVVPAGGDGDSCCCASSLSDSALLLLVRHEVGETLPRGAGPLAAAVAVLSAGSMRGAALLRWR
jgi:hypothetical protein